MAPSPLPVPNSTIPFWRTELHPIDDHRSTPELPTEVDIAVVGAGYAGASVVYHILNKIKDKGVLPPSIAILEARQACSGATGRNGKAFLPRSTLIKVRKEKDRKEADKMQAATLSPTLTTVPPPWQ